MTLHLSARACRGLVSWRVTKLLLPAALGVAVLAALAVGPAAAAPAGTSVGPLCVGDGHGPGHGDGHDPDGDLLVPMVRRLDRYFSTHRVDGVTLDARYPINLTEAIRMSVVSQLLGYVELQRVHPTRRLRARLTVQADYLGANLEPLRTHGPFDGMLAYSLLETYELTGERRFLDNGEILIGDLMALPLQACTLNGGLMVVMALAEHDRLVGGDLDAESKVWDIMTLLGPYQHPDGSFPHWCTHSTDIHYTNWMAMELIHIQRTMPDSRIPPMLARMDAFIESHMDTSGRTRYEEPCTAYPGCIQFFDSRRTGCSIDYDTRGWVNELGYRALTLAHFHSPRYAPTMRFLHSLEDRGTYADKWDYFPPVTDPIYVWASADTSVARMSLVFWSLATVLSERADSSAVLEEPVADGGPAPEDERAPNVALVASPEFAGLPAPRWTTVDSLLMAGADPGAFCDAPDRRALPIGHDGRPVSDRPDPQRPVAPTRESDATPLHAESGPSACVLRFTLPARGAVSLVVLDATGRRVRSLVSETLGPGGHEVGWDRRDASGRPCPSGVYFVQLRTDGLRQTTRVAVVR